MNDRSALAFAALLLMMASPALAHTGIGGLGGVAAGFVHPIGGIDHIVAMVAVGLWGVMLGAPAIWLLPVVFPIVMALGGTIGASGIPLPGVEAGIALSGVTLGLMIATRARPPLWIAAMIVGLFAIFHGHAHGTELPSAANPVSYALGFVLATCLMHLAGILIGTTMKGEANMKTIRLVGAAIAMTGGVFLSGIA